MTFPGGEFADPDHDEAFAAALVWFPAFFLLVWSILAFNPATYSVIEAPFLAAREFAIVEVATAVFLLFATLAGLLVAWIFHRTRQRFAAVMFGLFSAGCSVVMMEEVRWLQPILGHSLFASSTTAGANADATLHTMIGLQGREAVLHLVFCMAAIVLTLDKVPFVSPSRWALLKPRRQLMPLVAIIFIVALLRGYTEFVGNPFAPQTPVVWTMEVMEMFIGLWVAAYAMQKLIEGQGFAIRRARVVSTLGKAHYALKNAKVRPRRPAAS